MFRVVVLGAALLAGCGSEEVDEPHVVNMYNVEFKGNNFENLKDCVWEQVNLKLFKSEVQRLKFQYLACPKYNVKFEIKGGDTLIKKIQHRDIVHFNSTDTILKVVKLGPSTEEEFMKSQIPFLGRNNKKCKVFKIAPNVWKKESSYDWAEVTSMLSKNDRATSDPCGAGAAYPDYEMEGDDFIFKDRMVFIKMSGLGGIDKSSITYENRG